MSIKMEITDGDRSFSLEVDVNWELSRTIRELMQEGHLPYWVENSVSASRISQNTGGTCSDSTKNPKSSIAQSAREEEKSYVRLRGRSAPGTKKANRRGKSRRGSRSRVQGARAKRKS